MKIITTPKFKKNKSGLCFFQHCGEEIQTQQTNCESLTGGKLVIEKHIHCYAHKMLCVFMYLKRA